MDVGPFNFFLKLEHCNEIKAEPNAPHYFQKQPMMRTLISKTCMEIAPAWISVAILKVLRIWLCVLFILICMFGQIIDIIRQQCFLCNIYSINFRKEINAQRKQREISLADRILPTQRASASIDHPDLSTRSTFRNMDFHCELSPSHQKKHRP